MNCKTNRIDLCHVQAETWTDRTVIFDRNVSDDDFELTVTNVSGFIKTIDLSPIGNRVVISDLDLKQGRYFLRLVWISGGVRRIVFEGNLSVLSKGIDGLCGTKGCEMNFTIEDCEEIVNVEIVESVVNIKGATIDVDSTVTIDSDEHAKVENVGTEEDVRLKFYIPKGGGGVSEEWLNDLAERVTDAEISFEDLQNSLYGSLNYLFLEINSKADKSEAYSNQKVEAYLKSLDGFGEGKTLTVENGEIKWK